MKPNKNVCFVVGTLGQGGAERQLYYMLKSLREQGESPRVLCLTQGEFWEERIQKLGVPVTWVGQSGSFFSRLSRIISEVRNDPPGLLQSAHFYTNLYVLVTAGIVGLPGIGAMRNDGDSEVKETGKIGGWLCLHGPRVVAANSRAALEFARAQGIPSSRLYFLPNVVDTDYLKPSDKLNENPVKLFAVGRLAKQKNLDRYLRVLDRLQKKTQVPFMGVIVGDGPLRPQLEAQATRLGLFPGAVSFRGKLSDISEAYREADVLVLTSDHEGTPNVVLEAMSCGLPVVATRVGGVADIVRHGETGYLFEPEDEDGMVSALSELVAQPSLRRKIGAQARDFIQQRHALARLPEYLGGLYDRTLSY